MPRFYRKPGVPVYKARALDQDHVVYGGGAGWRRVVRAFCKKGNPTTPLSKDVRIKTLYARIRIPPYPGPRTSIQHNSDTKIRHSTLFIFIPESHSTYISPPISSHNTHPILVLIFLPILSILPLLPLIPRISLPRLLHHPQPSTQTISLSKALRIIT
ncbi:hypothetical protein BZA77DRAFT_342470 [Pyronema omphalodes]|nr:hypothetical protein BZA77DRAFT_342470 [Pyronema omphalodes]